MKNKIKMKMNSSNFINNNYDKLIIYFIIKLILINKI